VRRRNLLSATLISSFDAHLLERIGAGPGSPALALNVKNVRGRETADLCRRLKVFSLHPNARYFSLDHVRQLHGAGINIFPYNVGSASEGLGLLRAGADGLIVNDPTLLTSLPPEESVDRRSASAPRPAPGRQDG
jgi:glycerophosphoryl diester phosphodiesterase